MPVPETEICRKKLTEDEAAEFRDAITRHYWYELFMDDLPMWSFVGEVGVDSAKQPQMLIYTHKQLNISYNNDQVRADAELAASSSSSPSRTSGAAARAQ